MSENGLDKKNVESILPLTPLQKGMLFHYLQDNSSSYTEQLVLTLKGNMDMALLEKAWNLLIAKYDVLRCVLRWEHVKQPVQVVLKHIELPFSVFDLSDLVPQEKQRQKEDLILADRCQRFDIKKSCIRVTVIKDISQFEMVVSNLNVMYDGWSIHIIMSSLFRIYGNLLAGTDIPHSHNAQFAEYLSWINRVDKETSQSFWIDYLSGYEVVNVALENEACSAPRKLHTLQREIPQELLLGIDRCNKELSLSSATVYYLAWGILLQRYYDRDDIVFGTVVSGRQIPIPRINEMVGLLTNCLPLRIKLEDDCSTEQVLRNLSEAIITRCDHEFVGLSDIKQACGYTTHINIFESIVVMENYPKLDLAQLDGIDILDFKLWEETEYDLILKVSDYGKPEIQIQFDQNKYPELLIETFLDCITMILEQLISRLSASINSVELVPTQHKALLDRWNQTSFTYDDHLLLYEVFERAALQCPDKPAVCCNGQVETYQSLNRKANQFANHLARIGIAAGDRVAVYMQRSVEALVVTLGILKANAVCVPLDIHYPEERNRTILKNSESRLLVHDASQSPMNDMPIAKQSYVAGTYACYPKQNLPNKITSDAGAYMLYTSGSTGVPKGILLSHKGIHNHLYAKCQALGMKNDYQVANTFSANVVASIWQIWSAITLGATLHIYSYELEIDVYSLLKQLKKDSIDIVQLIPSQLDMYLQLIERDEPKIALPCLKKIALTSEEIKPDVVRRYYMQYDIPLVNCYGQTECSDDVAHYTIPSVPSGHTVPLGYPSCNTRIHVMNSHRKEQPIGFQGEICISGDGVSQGYWKLQQLTDAKFVWNACENDKMYLTGDIGKWSTEGRLLYFGRKDHQIKIRGNRIELNEIENRLAEVTGIGSFVVMALKEFGENVLFAFYEAQDELSSGELRQKLQRYLPNYMVPSHFIHMENLPRLANGKIDRSVLKEHQAHSMSRQSANHRSDSSMVSEITAMWQSVLNREEIGGDERFFEAGGNSLSIVKLRSLLQNRYTVEIPIQDIFLHPTIHDQADYITKLRGAKGGKDEVHRVDDKELDRQGIAVVGVSGRFPQSGDVYELWQNLLNKRECITFFAEDDANINSGSHWVHAEGLVDDPDMFDADFFGFTKSEAEITDPQHRLFLECVWEALDDAGVAIDNDNNNIGVFAGVGPNTYLLNNLLHNPELVRRFGELSLGIGNEKDYIAMKASYKLGLTGPSVNVQSTCSTSLLAVHLACNSLRLRECDTAIAGGAHVRVSPQPGFAYVEGGVVCSDGHCKPFDERADGTIFSSGSGVVVLKRLQDALHDNDHIYAVIKGSAINNDGSQKVSFTAPNAEMQAGVITKAYQTAQVDMNTIGYIEAHGTGTKLGDPIEIAALNQAFSGTDQAFSCPIGSIKSNIGHMDAGSGIAGLIKAILIVRYGLIPPSINYSKANPNIDFGRFFVARDVMEWGNEQYPRRAGVSSFGTGGTNVHMVLEQSPVINEQRADTGLYLLPISARSSVSCVKMTGLICERLTGASPNNLQDVASALQNGRKAFAHRKVLIGSSVQEITEQAAFRDPVYSGAAPHTIYLFPGVLGIDYVNANRWLYRNNSLYRSHVDLYISVVSKICQINIQGAFHSGVSCHMDDFARQLVLFVSEYALANALMQWGVYPDKLVGDGAGEYAAACIAGVITLEEAINLMHKANTLSNDEFGALTSQLRFKKPKIPIQSSAASDESALHIHRWYEYQHQPADLLRAIRMASEQDDNAVLLKIALGNHLIDDVLQDSDAKTINCGIADRAGHEHHAFYVFLKALWETGYNLHWHVVFDRLSGSHAILPPYAFDRTRYWIDKAEAVAVPSKQVDTISHERIDEWLYTLNWKERKNICTQRQEAGTYLIFCDEGAVNAQLLTGLQGDHPIFVVNSAPAFTKLAQGRYGINIDDRADYSRLLDDIPTTDSSLKIIHMLSAFDTGEDRSFQESQHIGLYSLLFIAQALQEITRFWSVELSIVTNGVYDITGTERLYPASATMLATCQVFQQELPHVKIYHIDLSFAGVMDRSILVGLLQELRAEDREMHVAIRSGRRWGMSVNHLFLPSATPDRILDYRDKTCIVFGGLGNIGLCIAQFLARQETCHIVLVNRSEFLHREQWDLYMEMYDDDVSHKIGRLKEIEKSGSILHLLQCDIGDRNDMLALRETVNSTIGTVNFLFHAAGIMGVDTLHGISDTNVNQLEEQYDAKVYGLSHIADVFGDDIEAVVYSSSLSVYLGGLGMLSYAAANTYMDFFAAARHKHSRARHICINWDAWDFGGSEIGPAIHQRYSDGLMSLLLTRDDIPQNVLVSTTDLQARFDKWDMKKQHFTAEDTYEMIDGLTTGAAVDLSDLEDIVNGIWRELLGNTNLHADDNLFELGAHSLLSIQFIARMRELYKIVVPIQAVFDYPTVRKLSCFIGNKEVS